MNASRTASEHGIESTTAFAAAVQDQLRRVLASDSFRGAQRMADFLRFIVTQTLAGNENRLKEYVIAVEVFGRGTSFDTRTNSVVRVEASRLRHRLSEYFLGPGSGDAIRIELPAGSYVPQFKPSKAVTKPMPNRAPVSARHGSTSQEIAKRPKIAVLPFEYLGVSSRHKYLAHGISQALSTALSRGQGLHVLASYSAFNFRGRAQDVKRLGRECGVRYVVEGCVRHEGNRVRAFARCIDVTTGTVLLAEQYDQELEDELLLEETLARRMAAMVERTIGSAERERAMSGPVSSVDAWGLYQRGIVHMYRFTPDDSRQAQRFLRRAAAADAQFAAPLGALAYGGFLDSALGFADNPGETLATAVAEGCAAVARNAMDPMAHFGYGRALSLSGQMDAALSELKISIDLNPNFAPGHLGVGGALSVAGRHREAIDALDTAIALSPYDPMLWTMENLRALSHLELAQFDKAVDDARRACCHPNSVPWAYVTLVSSLSNLGREQEAREARDALFRRWPEFSVERFWTTVQYDPAVTPNWRRGLRKTGLIGVT